MGGCPSGRRCDEVGCLKAVVAWGMCDMHYRRWRKHGSPDVRERAASGELRRYVEARAPLCEPDRCEVLWPFKSRSKGRPMLHVRGERIGAVHYAYFVVFGERPAQLNHRCHNGECWNPHHVYPGTPAQNTEDMVRAGRAWRQDLVTRTQALAIRDRYLAGGISQQRLADEAGISQIVVSRIVRGTHWTTRTDITSTDVD
jgi:hypothetical protein